MRQEGLPIQHAQVRPPLPHDVTDTLLSRDEQRLSYKLILHRLIGDPKPEGLTPAIEAHAQALLGAMADRVRTRVEEEDR